VEEPDAHSSSVDNFAFGLFPVWFVPVAVLVRLSAALLFCMSGQTERRVAMIQFAIVPPV
jgi:hypothetical protein